MPIVESFPFHPRAVSELRLSANLPSEFAAHA
jgi:hypothetical protein